jgi:hypothetical protein
VTNDDNRNLALSVLSVIVLLMDVGALLGMAIMFPMTADRFRRVFADMGHALPGLTVFFLGIPAVVYPLVFGGLAVALVVKEFLLRPAAKLGINIVVLPLALLTAGAYFASLFLPMMQVLQAVQK